MKKKYQIGLVNAFKKTGVQPTSRNAYRELKKLGKLGDMQVRVLKVFVNRMDWTNRELAVRLGWDTCQTVPRVKELRDLGLLEFSRQRNCSITGRRVMAWRKVIR